MYDNSLLSLLFILIFSLFKEEHPQNIPSILLTLVVLNEDKSIDFKEEHPENIKRILLIFVVLNEDKFIDSKEGQS